MSGTTLDGLDNRQDVGRFIVEYLEQNPLPMSAVDGLSQAVQAGPWVPLSFKSGWSVRSGEPAWRSLPGGLVELRGDVTHPAATFGATIAELPVDVAAKNTHNFVVQITGGTGLVQISGSSLLYASATVEVNDLLLDSVIYPVAG